MLIFRHRSALRQHFENTGIDTSRIGFVPTMGALHKGHISLIDAARNDGCTAVASIFVNPTQFNDPGDLAKYPKPIGADIEQLEAAGCEILYLPEAEDVYDGSESIEQPDLKGLDLDLEGASRPGHFAGVAQVVRILLEIVRPHRLYMGQKDYQQVQVVQSMIDSYRLPVELVMCPIIREDNGLAMSSRNSRLSPEMREAAGTIYHTLQKSVAASAREELSVIEQESKEHLNGIPGFEVDYFTFRDASSLQPIMRIQKGRPAILLTSVIVDGVRLLDNMLLPVSE